LKKRWHEKLFDVLLSSSTKAEEDIWIKDIGDHYNYITVYVDDTMVASKNPK
jgi:hypothetical protein